MRLLVLSNVAGSMDKVVDILQSRHNVVAKEANISESTIAANAESQLSSKAFDVIIVVARDPIQAGMLLNKKEGIDAAVCSSVEDVQLARNNGANAIVIRDINSDLLHDILSEVTGGGLPRLKIPQIRVQQNAAAPQQRARQAQEPEEERAQLFKIPSFKMPQLIPKQQPVGKRAMPSQKKAKQIAEPEEEERPRTPRSGSLVDKIKDYLGIV
ncbi:MAG: RpiB/LacA/LacB family sugar-phosphate isomerase [Candidatus Micrarchaeota archaeon]|nr:RpiB/LacA/LacB family sugar-phosphate isomerase [Candidatus Micrarchaeota archaeon]